LQESLRRILEDFCTLKKCHDAQGGTSPTPPAPGADACPRQCPPQGPFPMSAGGRQRGRFLAALACVRRPPPGGFGVHPATTLRAALACVRTPSGNRQSASGAALACVQTDRRPRRPATAVRLRAALGCIPATAIRHARQTCPEADRGVTTKIYVNDVNDNEDSKIF
jgi:hypothetical protein